MSRALWLTAVLACSGSAPTEPSEPSAEAEPTLEADPTPEPNPDTPADELARELWRAAGGEHLDEVAQIDFRFVVTDDGQTVFEAAHRWDRVGGRDRVSWTDREGKLNDVVVTLANKRACGHVDGSPVSGAPLAALGQSAHGRWVNDAYWLMVPLKVFDPGVTRRLLEPAGELRQLELTFEGVGLTPGDRYVLQIDPEGRLTRWEMSLEGSEPGEEPKGVTFEGHRDVGPLTLPLEHTAEGEGNRQVLLRDVVVHEAVQEASFAIRGCEG